MYIHYGIFEMDDNDRIFFLKKIWLFFWRNNCMDQVEVDRSKTRSIWTVDDAQSGIGEVQGLSSTVRFWHYEYYWDE